MLQLGYCKDGDIKTLDFERTSRTDSKVSAALSILTLWCTNPVTLHEELNSLLPADIRVFACQRTTPRFNCRTMCTSRRYEYVLPVQMLMPNSMFY